MGSGAGDLFATIKTEISLVDFMLAHGCELDQKQSTRHNPVLRNGADDKFSVSNKGGVWVYNNFKDDTDGGTIIDFCEKHLGITGPKALREKTKEWVELPEQTYQRYGLDEKRKFAATQKVGGNDEAKAKLNRIWHVVNKYATKVPFPYRGIPIERMAMANILYNSKRETTYFPIDDLKGRNVGILTRDALGKNEHIIYGSEKQNGLWISGNKLAKNIIVSESPIDALSMTEYYKADESRHLHFSVLGQPADNQINLIRKVAKLRAEQNRQTVYHFAFDNDSYNPIEDFREGKIAALTYIHKMVNALREYTGKTIVLSNNSPEKTRFKDWNDLLVEAQHGKPTGMPRIKSKKIPVIPYWTEGERNAPHLIIGDTPTDVLGYKVDQMIPYPAFLVATLGQTHPTMLKRVGDYLEAATEHQKVKVHIIVPDDKVGEAHNQAITDMLKERFAGRDRIIVKRPKPPVQNIHGTDRQVSWTVKGGEIAAANKQQRRLQARDANSQETQGSKRGAG